MDKHRTLDLNISAIHMLAKRHQSMNLSYLLPKHISKLRNETTEKRKET